MTHSRSRFEVERLRSLFPGPVSIESVLVSDSEVESLLPLTTEELSGRTMATKRLREFRAGRHCAKKALAALGEPTSSLPRDDDGVPLYPAGVAASITHTGRDLTLAIAAAARGYRGLGIDAEALRSLEPEVVAQIATREELSLFDGFASVGSAAIVLFSAKESFYKCAYPEMRTFLGFHDVTLKAVANSPSGLSLELFSERASRAGGPDRLWVPSLLLEDYVVSCAVWDAPSAKKS